LHEFRGSTFCIMISPQLFVTEIPSGFIPSG
jgi:hypothetical protein